MRLPARQRYAGALSRIQQDHEVVDDVVHDCLVLAIVCTRCAMT